jgi:hypothetical protein
VFQYIIPFIVNTKVILIIGFEKKQLIWAVFFYVKPDKNIPALRFFATFVVNKT